MPLKRMALVAAVVCSLLLVANSARGNDHSARGDHRSANTADATLYEVVENVKYNPIDGVIHRGAIAALMGVVKTGTPLCSTPELLANPTAKGCTVTGVGRDNISVVTGQGPVSGQFSVVVNAPGNSSVHVPDLPVLTGTFSGDIDLSPAVGLGIPLGYVRGRFTVEQVLDTTCACLVPIPPQDLPFSGTFRLPFALDAKGHAKEHEDRQERAFYLGDDGRLMEVLANERTVGFPAVRLDIRFTQ